MSSRAALLLVFLVSCGKGGERVKPPAEPQLAEVVLKPAGAPEASVHVRLARTDADRRRGLMYVENLPADQGMLFLMDEEEVQTFWMKNTLIPLDMIFIRGDMKVAGVVENAEPLTTSERSVGKPSRFVLEVNGGWAAQHGVGEGTPVVFKGVP